MKYIFYSALLLLTVATGVALLQPELALAAPKDEICGGVNIIGGGGGKTCGGSDKPIGDLAQTIVTVFSIVVGIAAVIMIMVGGFKYITSGGDSGSINSAKSTITYAVIGLVVVALAQVIVQYVLRRL